MTNRTTRRATPATDARFRYSMATRRKAVKMYVAGKSPLDIAAATGASDSRVRKWAKDAKVWPRPRCTPHNGYTDKDRREAVRLYEQGLTISAIAAKKGWGIGTVRRWLNAAKVKMRVPHRKPQHDRKTMKRLYRRFKTYSAVGYIMGCAESTVRYALGKGR